MCTSRCQWCRRLHERHAIRCNGVGELEYLTLSLALPRIGLCFTVSLFSNILIPTIVLLALKKLKNENSCTGATELFKTNVFNVYIANFSI